jgi:apolipoprotein N-acyltransferase
LPGPLAATLALASGLLLVPAFPPQGLWWLAPVAVAAFVAALRKRSTAAGAGLGLLHGAAFFVPLLSWSGIYVGAVPWLLLAGLQTSFVVLLGALAPLVLRLPAWPVFFAALWVAAEALRGRVPWGGFTWGRLAFAQAEAPTLGLAALGGAPLLSFALALSGALLAAAACALAGRHAHRRHASATRGGRAGPVWRTVGPLLGAVAVLLAGLAVPPSSPSGEGVTVAVVQGNVPQLGLDFNAQREAVLRNHVQRTEELAAGVAAGRWRQPDLVVWPENSSDIDPLQNPDAAALVDRAAAAVGVPVLVGAVLTSPEPYISNVGIVWDPRDGPGQRYVKRHPVPFGEYIPLRPLARLVSEDVDRVRRDMVAGEEPGVLRVGPALLGDVICFEVAYDGLVRDAVVNGAEALVVQTNNATFGLTGQSAQQLAMSRVRAVEHGRWVLVAATSGLSAVVAPDGTLVAETDLFTEAVLVEQVRLAQDRTLATRLGAWPEAVLFLVALGAVAAGAQRRRQGDEQRRR